MCNKKGMKNEKSLKDYLGENRLSQADFAKRIGVSSSMVSRYINGLCNPPLDVVAKISTATNGEIGFSSWVNAR